MRKWVWLLLIIWLAACDATAGITPEAPQLVREVTVASTVNGAEVGRLNTNIPSPTRARITPEVVSPLNEVTVDARFVLVTPTLPPSKTPTHTPTRTQTPTVTATPSRTATSTATVFLLPTSELIAATADVAAPSNRICDSNWAFIEPAPESCPLSPPTASPGVYQEFSNGFMVWVGTQDAIYVLYNDGRQPAWEVYRDQFEEFNPSMAYLDGPPRQVGTQWTPRRGFGLLWEQNDAVRSRIGGAIQQWEEPYSVQTQTSDDGVIFISTPQGYAFGLVNNRSSWQRYSSGVSSSGIFTGNP